MTNTQQVKKKKKKKGLRFHPYGLHYLQAGALVRERRAEEACDNAHDCLSYITLQRGVCMLPVAGVVAHLGTDRGDISMMRSRSIRLPACGQQVRSPHDTLSHKPVA